MYVDMRPDPPFINILWAICAYILMFAAIVLIAIGLEWVIIFHPYYLLLTPVVAAIIMGSISSYSYLKTGSWKP